VSPEPPFPFIVGVNRSGTTLLRLMLDAHPDLAIPPETHFVPDLIAAANGGATAAELADLIVGAPEWGDFGISADELASAIGGAVGPGDSVRAFHRLYASRFGKPRFGDKTPAYGRSMTAIAAAVPEAHFIHLIRDGRDVYLSIRDRSPRPRPPERVAERWRGRILGAREQAAPHYREFRYEELVRAPEATLRAICEWISLRWDPAVLAHATGAGERLAEMDRALPARGDRAELDAERRMETHRRALGPPDSSRVGRWRRELGADEAKAFESVAGDVLGELGYEVPSR